MKPDPTSANESFIDELRDSGTVENTLVSRLGFYKANEVDRYIAHLQDQLSGTEAVYQDRFEEMRTSLLGMTRERDEKISQVRQLENRLAAAEDLDALLLKKGQVSVAATDYEKLLAEKKRLELRVEQLQLNIQEQPDKSLLNMELSRSQDLVEKQAAEIENLEKTLEHVQAQLAEQLNKNEIAHQIITDLTSERNQAVEKHALKDGVVNDLQQTLHEISKDLNQFKHSNDQLEQQTQAQQYELTAMKEKLSAKADELFNAEQALTLLRKQSAEIQLQFDTLRMQLSNLTDSLAQSRSQYQLLEAQYQIGQEMVNKLMVEKSSLENEIKNQQQRFEFQREAMATRFQSVLNSQNEFLKKLQENFNASVRYMENLTETGLRGFNEENR
ncbi:MAG: hypothetical protein PHQ83_06800 [Eubacteriales bacterium]|nr:hypothetical protein [Eubacteriales bacterium]